MVPCINRLILFWKNSFEINVKKIRASQTKLTETLNSIFLQISTFQLSFILYTHNLSRFWMFLKMSLMLTKAAFIWSKYSKKQ